MKGAVVALIMNNGKVLSVSRKTDYNDRGFPGGAIENNESDQDAIIREVFEETGLTIIKCRLIDDRLDDSGVEVKMFVVDEYSGEINTTETGLVEWVEPMDLCSGNCTFRGYNWDLFKEKLFVEMIYHKLTEELVYTDEFISDGTSGDKYIKSNVYSDDLGITITVDVSEYPAINREVCAEVMHLAINRTRS